MSYHRSCAIPKIQFQPLWASGFGFGFGFRGFSADTHDPKHVLSYMLLDPACTVSMAVRYWAPMQSKVPVASSKNES